MTAKSPIPEITEERLEQLAERIRPVVRYTPRWIEESNKLAEWTDEARERINRIPKEEPGDSPSNTGIPYWVELPKSLRSIAYTWEPKPYAPAFFEIEQFAHIITYHDFGAPVLFKPSIAEVLAQIPEHLIEETVAFEIRTADLTCVNVCSVLNCHWAPCILYRKRRQEW